MTKDMTQGSPLRLILAFAVPLMLGSLFQQFYNLADTIIVGRFVGVEALAAVGSVGGLNYLVLGFVNGIACGFSIPISWTFGAKDYREMRRYTANAVWLSLFFAAVLTVVTVAMTRSILVWTNTPDNIIDLADVYIRTIFVGIPFTLLYNMTSALMRALGDSKRPLYFLLVASFLNIGLDLLCIIVFRMGAFGAAFATVFSQAVAGLGSLLYILKHYGELRWSREEGQLSRTHCAKLCSMGIPMGLQCSITAIGSVVLQGAVNGLGSDIVAAQTAGGKAAQFLAVPLESIGTAMTTYASQNMGAHDLNRVNRGVNTALGIGVVYSIASFLILRVSEIYEQAKKLQIDIDAEGYTVILLTLQSRGTAEYSQTLAERLEELMAYLLRYGEYLLFRCNLMTYCVIVKGSAAGLDEAVRRCLENIERRCGGDEALAWYAAVSEPVARLSELPGCYASAHTILSYRHLLPERHVLTADVLQKPQRGTLPALDEVDASKADPAIIRNFLQTGMREEIPDFVSEYLASFGNALDSMLFRQYVLLELRFSAIRAANSFGYSQEEFLRPLTSGQELPADGGRETLEKSCAALLRRAIELREEESGNQYKSMLKRALRYIDQNYTDETLSLNTVAKAANISPNYFSGVFSQEMGQTFVEYLTEKRMERAKELLRYSGKRSSEVAYEVGYRDPRYFSFLFKKTQGCTPSSYRAGNGDGHEAK